jgi:hypothetical protein
MAYQPLTKEQYDNAVRSGFSHDQIVQNEIQRKASMTESAPAPKQNLLQKAGSVVNAVFPGKQVGQAIGTAAGYGITALKEKMGSVPKGTTEQYDLSAPSPKRVVADVASGALNVAGFKGVGTSGPFLQRVAKTFGLGAGLGASETIKNGGTVREAVKSGATVGAISGALPVAGAALRGTGRQIQALPDRFLNSALGRSKSQILKDISTGKADTLNKYVLTKKPIGTARQLAQDASISMRNLNTQIQSKLAGAVRSSGSKVTVGRDILLDQVAQTPNVKGALMNRTDVADVIKRLAPQTRQMLQKPSLTLEEANRLRVSLDSTLGDRAFLGAQISNEKEILKSFANTLRESVKSKAPPEVRGLFSDYSNEIQLRNALLGVIAQKSKNQVISIGDVFGGALGGVLGGGFTGAVAGVAARRAIESVPTKIAAAKIVNAVSKVAPLIDELTPAQQTAILVLIAELVSPDENDRELDPQLTQ